MRFKLKWNVKDGDSVSPSYPSIKIDLDDIVNQVMFNDDIKQISHYPNNLRAICYDDLLCKHNILCDVIYVCKEYVEIETFENDIINTYAFCKINPFFKIEDNKAVVIALFVCYNLKDNHIAYY